MLKLPFHRFLNVVHHYARTCVERELTEDTVERLRKLDHELIGAMTSRVGVKTRAADEPPQPWWWRGDDEATEVNFEAMRQLQLAQ